jgi:hypothetical protein
MVYLITLSPPLQNSNSLGKREKEREREEREIK